MASDFIRYDEGPDDKWVAPGPIARFLSRVLPQANPDFEHLYRSVSYWYLELDKSKPVREVGFSDSGVPIVIGAYEDNRGMWTDSPVLLTPSEYPEVSVLEFESAWNAFCEQVKCTMQKRAATFANELEAVRAGRAQISGLWSKYVDQPDSSHFEEILSFVNHYVSDDDIRAKDPQYREMQEREFDRLLAHLRAGRIAEARRVTFPSPSE